MHFTWINNAIPNIIIFVHVLWLNIFLYIFMFVHEQWPCTTKCPQNDASCFARFRCKRQRDMIIKRSGVFRWFLPHSSETIDIITFRTFSPVINVGGVCGIVISPRILEYPLHAWRAKRTRISACFAYRALTMFRVRINSSIRYFGRRLITSYCFRSSINTLANLLIVTYNLPIHRYLCSLIFLD